MYVIDSVGELVKGSDASAERAAGAFTLLCECVAAKPGERLLIVSEPEGSGFYDEDAPRLTASAARSLGIKVYQTQLPAYLGSVAEKDSLCDTLRGFDHVIFFSRVGDQIRFSDNSEMPLATMCYTLDLASLSSEFGTACYHGLCEIKNAIDQAFMSAAQIRVTCPRGTDYSGRPMWGVEPAEVTLKRFPMLIACPVPAAGFSGRVALSRFLVGTGSCVYEPYYLSLPKDVFACIENNRITRFEGDSADVELVSNHYRQVSGYLAIEPWYVDSWHAGIHPGCYFENNAEADILRWCTTAFGNPRLLHFHTCGEYAPGEISWNVLDPTIYLDDIVLWESGSLRPERLPDGAQLMARHPRLEKLYQNPYRNIGLRA